MLIATSARVHSFLATLGALTTVSGALLILAGIVITLARPRFRRRFEGAIDARAVGCVGLGSILLGVVLLAVGVAALGAS